MNNNIRDQIIDELKHLAEKVSTAYQEQLRAQKIHATGRLSKSEVEVEYKNDKYEIVFYMPDYWDIVEYGRKKGTYPPPRAIKNWIRVKKLIPSGKKKLSQDSLAYVIGRKIAKQGIPGRHPLEHAIDRVDRQLDDTADEIADIMVSILEDTLNELIKK